MRSSHATVNPGFPLRDVRTRIKVKNPRLGRDDAGEGNRMAEIGHFVRFLKDGVARLANLWKRSREEKPMDVYEALRTIQTLARKALESEKDEWLSAERLVEIQRRTLKDIEAATKKALANAPQVENG